MKKLKLFLMLHILTTIKFSKCFAQLLQVNPTLTEEFLKNLLNNNFPHCTLLFLQDRYDNSDTLNFIVENTHYMNYFNIKYSFPTPHQIHDVENSVKLFHLSSATFTSNITSILTSESSLPLKFPVTVSNYHRRTDQCVVSIMMISDIRPQFMSQINTLLNPVYIPIIQKDMDYFIFLTRPHLMNRLMLMKEYPARIKYKIAVGEISQAELTIRTVCFFCGDRGTPTVLQFPSAEYSKDTDYFPDMVKNLNGKTLEVSCPYMRARIEVDPPFEGIGNARRGVWKNLFEEYMTVWGTVT
jgi:hypothetical protein